MKSSKNISKKTLETNKSNNVVRSFTNSSFISKSHEIDVKEYIKTDLDDMDYDGVIKQDHRKFFQYFKDNIITDILILNTFFNKEKLNPWPIKCILLILNIELYFFVNGLFFTEEYLKDTLYDKDVNFFDFVGRFMTRISYIMIIGIIIGYIVNCFFFEEKILKKYSKEKKMYLISKKK